MADVPIVTGQSAQGRAPAGLQAARAQAAARATRGGGRESARLEQMKDMREAMGRFGPGPGNQPVNPANAGKLTSGPGIARAARARNAPREQKRASEHFGGRFGPYPGIGGSRTLVER